MARRIRKLFAALADPGYWPALARGVVPGIEHGAAFAGRDYATVLDVGANKGQFAAFARNRWPNARLVCFEPLPEPRRRLVRLLGRSADVHPTALGNRNGEAVMHLASREDSSSLLPLGDTQKRLFAMDEERQLEVQVERLDSILDADRIARPALLKIDVQGFEYEVLQGATGLLGEIQDIYVECSFVELYVGQKFASDVAVFLSGFGFTESGRYNICKDGEAVVQADLLFTSHHQ